MNKLPVPNSVKEVDALISEMVKLRDKRKELDAALEAAKDALKAYMTENKLEAFKSANSAASYAKGLKQRFDAKRFKEECPVLYDQYLMTESFSQLRFDVEKTT